MDTVIILICKNKNGGNINFGCCIGWLFRGLRWIYC